MLHEEELAKVTLLQGEEEGQTFTPQEEEEKRLEEEIEEEEEEEL